MESSTVERLLEFKDKFKKFFVHKKKLKALTNYSNTVPIEKNHKTAIKLIENFADAGFLEEMDVVYLNHVLERYNVKFTEWAHKTKWLQDKMKSMSAQSKAAAKPQYRQMDIFELMEKQKKDQYSKVPVEVLAKQQQAAGLHV